MAGIAKLHYYRMRGVQQSLSWDEEKLKMLGWINNC
jgi:hypothetical protein